jgi:type IVB pilus formation R64 PilN family outer membrane protein
MTIKKIATLSALSTAMLLAGCSVVDKSYDTVRDDMGGVKKEIAKNRAVKKSSVLETDDIWLGGEAFKISDVQNAPAVLKRTVSFKQIDPISVGELVTMLSVDLGVKIILTQDAIEYTSRTTNSGGDPANEKSDAPAVIPGGNAESSVFGQMSTGSSLASDTKFTLDFKGSVAQLLDVISGKTGLFWRWEHGEIVIKRNETKTYVLDITPGKTEFEAEMKSDLASGDDKAGSSVHSTKSEIKPDGAWESLEKSLNTILSESGKLAFAEAVGTITVTDTPQVQTRVAEFIKSINNISSKQIAVKADVFEITSDENGDFDSSITALYDWKGILNIGVDGGKLTIGKGNRDTTNNNQFTKADAAVNLLRTNKNASLVTSSTIYAMNGQATPFQQMDEIGYLAQVTVTQGENVNPQSSLTPGKTSQGFSMMILPRILSDGRVMMNFAVDSSRINSIDEYGTEQQGKIQLPNRSTNKYQQLVAVHSGEPLMIAGMERTENTAQIGSMLGRYSWFLGGTQKGGKRKIMTMIVLTPYIMQK